MGDEDEGDADLALDALQLDLHLLAQLEVERAERLVEQQDLRVVHERTGQRDALLLAARQLRRPPLLVSGQLDELEHERHLVANLVRRRAAAAQAERDVLEHAEVREERVALEDGVRRPLERRKVRHVGVAEEDPALADLLEAADHPQGGRLSAARRAQQREELARRDVERHLIDGDEVTEALGDVIQTDVGFRHASSTRETLSRCGRFRRV